METRNEMYKLMLRLYKEMIKQDSSGFCNLFGFCALLHPIWHRTYFLNFTEKEQKLLGKFHSLAYLPELMEYKPKEVFYTYFGNITNDPSKFWFPITETETRIKILEECIKKTQL